MTDPRWKHDGVRVIGAGQLDPNTAQTPGMDRKAALDFARVGAQKLWAGTVTIHAHFNLDGADDVASARQAIESAIGELSKQGQTQHTYSVVEI